MNARLPGYLVPAHRPAGRAVARPIRPAGLILFTSEAGVQNAANFQYFSPVIEAGRAFPFIDQQIAEDGVFQAGSQLLYWADPALAMSWFSEAVRRLPSDTEVARLDALPATDAAYPGNPALGLLPGGTWKSRRLEEQTATVQRVFEALANGYNALNIPWSNDPIARSIYQKWLAGPPQTEAGVWTNFVFGTSQNYGGTVGWYVGGYHGGFEKFPIVGRTGKPNGLITQRAVDLYGQYWWNPSNVTHHDVRFIPTLQLTSVVPNESLPANKSANDVNEDDSLLVPYDPTVKNAVGVLTPRRADAGAFESWIYYIRNVLNGAEFALAGYPNGSVDSAVININGTDYTPVPGAFSANTTALRRRPDGSKLLNSAFFTTNPDYQVPDWRNINTSGFDLILGAEAGSGPVTAFLGAFYYLDYVREWALALASGRTPAQIVQDSRAMVIYENAKAAQTAGGPAGFLQKATNVDATVAAEQSRPNSTYAAVGMAAATIGAALAPYTYGISALVGGAVALSLTVANAMIRKAVDIGRDDLGRYKPIIERGWLAGDPTSNDPTSKPGITVPSPNPSAAAAFQLSNPNLAATIRRETGTPIAAFLRTPTGQNLAASTGLGPIVVPPPYGSITPPAKPMSTGAKVAIAAVVLGGAAWAWMQYGSKAKANPTDDADRLAELVRTIDLPFVNARVDRLGGRPSVGVALSFDPKSEWKYGIFENSRHAKLMFHFDGSGGPGGYAVHLAGLKMRKFRFNSPEDAVSKLKRWIHSVPRSNPGYKGRR